MEQKLIQIAIDGPVAAGKGAVAQALARRLSIVNIDTGAMYRVATLLAMTRGIDVRDEEGIVQVLTQVVIEQRQPTEKEVDGRWNTIIVDGKDVSQEIRRKEIGLQVPKVAALPRVREIMVKKQQEMASKVSVVMEGRDIGSVVLPQATLKVYLDADLKERARRRWEERKDMGEIVEYDEMLNQVRARDEMDMTREMSPLKRLPEALYIDSTHITVDQVCELIEKSLLSIT